MNKDLVQSVGLPKAENADVARLCAQFGEGLHAMAQPLTVLRSAVITAIAPKVSELDQRRYMEISAEQVENACQLFQSLRELVFAWQNPADSELIDLSQLLASVDEVQGKVFRQAGMKLVVVTPASLLSAVGDKDRILQALFALLKITASVSAAGDSIELLVTGGLGEVELVLQNSRAQGKYLKSSARLILALAEANIRSQHGTFQLVEEPFRVIFSLPLQDVDSLESEKAHPSTELLR